MIEILALNLRKKLMLIYRLIYLLFRNLNRTIISEIKLKIKDPKNYFSQCKIKLMVEFYNTCGNRKNLKYPPMK